LSGSEVSSTPVQEINTNFYTATLIRTLQFSRTRHTSLLHLQILYQSPGNVFQRRLFHFLWVPELSPHFSQWYPLLNGPPINQQQQEHQHQWRKKQKPPLLRVISTEAVTAAVSSREEATSVLNTSIKENLFHKNSISKLMLRINANFP
jgi:hypothetical protein